MKEDICVVNDSDIGYIDDDFLQSEKISEGTIENNEKEFITINEE